MIPKLPDSWKEWQIEDLIGAGAYGNVYKAVNTHTNECTAIKIIRIPEKEYERFSIAYEYPEVEHQRSYYLKIVDNIVSKIEIIMGIKETKNIVKVFDYFVSDNEQEMTWSIFIRMELLIPFHEYCIYHTFNEHDVRKLAIDICQALKICEARNLIHRDIKPENILVDNKGNFKLTDFDEAGGYMSDDDIRIKGTFSYMAPEVFKNLPYDRRADQYSLGIVLYRLLNNNRDPFIDQNIQIAYTKEKEIALRKRMDGKQIPKPVNASEAMYKILKRMLSYNPKKRYKNLSDLEIDLIRYGYNDGSLQRMRYRGIKFLIGKLEKLL